MRVSFLTPVAALVGLGAVLALLALARVEQRSRRLAAALGLRPRSGLAGAADAFAIVLAGGLLALAAAQPVASTLRPREARTDAEAIFVLDISRSMLAREGREGATRFERAQRAAKELRATMPTVPVGVSSLTDRVLPYLFPTSSTNAFTATVDRAAGVQRPPPDRSGRGQATALSELSALATQNFYGVRSRYRLAVVFTDGESLPVHLGTLRARLITGRIVPIFIRLWSPDERVYAASGVPEPDYRPDPASGTELTTVAEATRGSVFEEDDLAGAAAAARKALGRGPTAPQAEELQAVELAPHVALAAFVPLLFLVVRRNVLA